MKNLITKEEKDRIDQICKKYKIRNYAINSDGTIDVDDSVYLGEMKLQILPLKFGKVTGGFNCFSNALSTLEGAPHTVGGNFACGRNPELHSLVGGPSKVGGNYSCYDCTLTSLVGAPATIPGNFWCQNNALSSLVGIPETIGNLFDCENNRLKSTYTGDVDPVIAGNILLTDNILPQLFMFTMYTNDNIVEDLMIKILKFQRHFMIWNDDLSLNEENFNDLIAEIKEGLE